MSKLSPEKDLWPSNAASSFVSSNKILALHCSASSFTQWKKLSEDLPSELGITPVDLVSHGSSAPWEGTRALSLDQEAQILLANATSAHRKFHLVGHSYGGSVALRLAVNHPELVESLVLIEPSSFHLLYQPDEDLEPHLSEIEVLVATFTERVVHGDYHAAMRQFTDYWNEPGTWGAMAEERRVALAAKAVIIAHHFSALMLESLQLADYGAITSPTLILCGTNSPPPSRAITRALARVIPHSRHRTIAGAGHMSPFTHSETVNPLIVAHLEQTL